MVDTRDRRRPTDARANAEAAFRKATTKPVAPAPVAAPLRRRACASVTLRLDSAVLAHFQKDGPGWQDRINAALKDLVARQG